MHQENKIKINKLTCNTGISQNNGFFKMMDKYGKLFIQTLTEN